MDQRPGPTVRLDGAAVRRVREAKGLTQLYVAEVVGVTVDTVSRWENNRTSAVKRENAEALAGALEVALGEILREGDGPADEPPPPPRPAARLRRPLLLAVLLALSGAVAVGLFRSPGGSITARRELPAYLTPGGTAPVVVRLRRLSGTGRRAVLREKLPPGWALESSTLAPDAGPGPDGLVRWIVPLNGPETLVGYVVRAPAGGEVGSAHRFRGEVVLPGRRRAGTPVAGDERTDLEWVHWADENGDFHLSDAELLEALERLDALKELRPDPGDLRPLWGAGQYQWDEASRSFRPSPR